MKLPRRNDAPSVTARLLEHDWSVLLYDGHCKLCTFGTRFVAERSRGRLLAFSAIQSHAARIALTERGDTSCDCDTLVVLTDSHTRRRSDAFIHVLQLLPAPWPQLAHLLNAVPRPLRDTLFCAAAHARGRLTRRATCMMTLADQPRRFIR